MPGVLYVLCYWVPFMLPNDSNQYRIHFQKSYG